MSAVTILLSTYNRASFLEEQLQSIVQQTVTDWRLVIRDDGSEDDTISMVRRFANKDERIVLLPIDGENKGPARSSLELLTEVNTPYFAFADQDDVWLPKKLLNSLTAMHVVEIADLPCAVFGDAVLIRADGSVRAPSALGTRWGARPDQVTFGELLLQNVVMGGTMLGNRRLAKEAAGLDSAGVPMHDWACALIAKHGGVLRYQPTRDLLHRQHEANVTGIPESRRARLRATVSGGPRGWRLSVRSPAQQIATSLAGLVRDPAVDQLARLEPEGVALKDVVRLQRASVRLRPTLRQVALICVSAQ